jgi:hypothetical protein
MWSVKEVLLKMMKRNYILFAIVALISVAMFPVSASATGNVGTASTSFSTEFNFDFDTEQTFTEEQLTEILNNGLGGNLNVGELTEVGITEDGSVLYATLVEESEISYANISKIPFANAQVQAYTSTTSRTVIFQLNILGSIEDIYKVKWTCYWYLNGANSYVDHMTGNFTALNSAFTGAWVGSSATPLAHSLDLDVYRNGSIFAKQGFMCFLNPLTTPPQVYMDFV